MKKVLVFGTFDIFHEGHKNMLKQAREHGDFLRVVVARDTRVVRLKGRAPKYSEQERLETIKESGLVDEVVLGDLEDRYKAVRDFRPDIICLGYDQRQSIEELQKKLDEMNIDAKIVRLNPFKPEIYKSSLLRKKYEQQ